MYRHVARVVVLHGLHEQFLRPRLGGLRRRIMLVLQHYWKRAPIALRLVSMVPRARRWLDENRIVAPADSFRTGIVQHWIISRLVGIAVDVVGDYELRPLEVLAPQVDMTRNVHRALFLRHPARSEGVTLAPETVGSDVYKRNFGAAVVSRGKCGYELLQLFEEYWIAEVGIPRKRLAVRRAYGSLPRPKAVLRALRPSVLYPLWRCVVHPVFRTCEAQGDLSAPGNPALCGRVDRRPVIDAFLWLKHAPRKPQVANGTAWEPCHVVAWLYFRAVVVRHVRVVVHRKPHVGISQHSSVVRSLKFCSYHRRCGNSNRQCQMKPIHVQYIPFTVDYIRQAKRNAAEARQAGESPSTCASRQ